MRLALLPGFQPGPARRLHLVVRNQRREVVLTGRRKEPGAHYLLGAALARWWQSLRSWDVMLCRVSDVDHSARVDRNTSPYSSSATTELSVAATASSRIAAAGLRLFTNASMSRQMVWLSCRPDR